MSGAFSRILSVLGAGLLLLSLIAWPGESIAAEKTTFSGQATGVKGSILGIPVGPLADTGPVASDGGALEATLLEYPMALGPDPLNNALHAEVLHAAVVAQGNQSSAEASVANLSLSIMGNTISGEFLMARAAAKCTGGNASVSVDGATSVTVNGTTHAVLAGQRQDIPLPGGGVVTINEQVGSASADRGDVTMRALHVVVPGVADVIVAEAHADILCKTQQPQCPTGKDFVTGGGWMPAGSGRASFGVAGGLKNGALWGHLTYIDHGTHMKVKGTGVTDYKVVDPTTREIRGTAQINGQPGSYQVIVSDKGEPGRNDTLLITLSNRYSASSTLSGGNIQLHNPCQ